MKKIFISGAVLTVIALISYFLIADDGGHFTVPAKRTQGVQCAGCLDIWDGKRTVCRHDLGSQSMIRDRHEHLFILLKPQ